MEIINYTQEQFNELLLHPLIGSDGKAKKGGFASIYVDPTKKYAVKVFDEERMREFVEEEYGPSIKEIVEEIRSISKNRVLQANNAVVLTHAFYVEYNLVGYFAKLIRGATLFEIKKGQFIPEISFDEFKKKYELLYQNVINISKEKIIMVDISDENIIYDTCDNRFKFIDLDGWFRKEKDKTDDIIKDNIDSLEEEFGDIDQMKHHFHK